MSHLAKGAPPRQPENDRTGKHAFKDATGTIIGCCVEVHKQLGPGFREIVYQRALAMELEAAGLSYEREVWIFVAYKGREVGKQRVDFIIEDILVEIKAQSELEPVAFVQTLSYLKASGCKVGLLVSFGAPKIEVKRLVN
ncbi:MAG: GxxExxY protein [Anaerolineae bacterium]